MDWITRLEEKDLDTFARITANAYPGIKAVSQEDIQKLRDRLLKQHNEAPDAGYYGLFRDEMLLGGMRLLDFAMTFQDARIKAGGVGMIGVDLLHKKEKVARDMVLFCLEHFRKKETSLVTLYPFRPDFYRRMGFGYGVKTNQFRVKPSSLPGSGDRRRLVVLGKGDQDDMANCYNRYALGTHGMFERSSRDFHDALDLQENRSIGYRKDGILQGYLTFAFRQDKDGRFLINDVLVKELVATAPEALSGLLTFLHTQSDQIRSVTFNTQDEHFHFLLADPRNGSDNLIPPVSHEINAEGLGLMYRVLDLPVLFSALGEHNFGGQTLSLRILIKDTFLGDSGVTVCFDGGWAEVVDDLLVPDAEISLDVADFSSLVVGAVDFRTLHAYGLVKISRTECVDTVNAIFGSPKPRCMTGF